MKENFSKFSCEKKRLHRRIYWITRRIIETHRSNCHRRCRCNGGGICQPDQKNSNIKVCFAARGERYDRLNGALIRVNGEEFDIPVVHPARVDRPFDLILVALKHHHLTLSVLGDIKAMAGEDTLILSVMNGLESEGLIGEVCGSQKLMPAIAIGIDAVHENGCFTFANPGKIIFGKTHSPLNAGAPARWTDSGKPLSNAVFPAKYLRIFSGPCGGSSWSTWG